MLAWHFTGDRLRDGRPLPAIGETLTHEGEIVWCESGLYASERLSDALRYAPGPMLSRVRCGQIERRDADKFVCRERTVLWRFDATDLLRADARASALSVIHLWDAPEVVRRYLETGDEATRADAWDAAWATRWSTANDAANAAARAAAWDATGDGSRNAAWAAALDAARGAARAATWATANAAVWDATWAAHNDRITAAAFAEAKRLGFTEAAE